MTSVTAVVLAVSVAATTEAAAQVDKPRSPSPAYRLPAPAKITAAQEPSGPIRVVWNAVEGAVSYKLIRSVPPMSSEGVALPVPSDTEYVDRDVKSGSHYYYVVSAVNDAGVGGLNISAPPVKAASATANLSTPGDPGTADASDSLNRPDVPVPKNVVARPYPYMKATVSWDVSHGVRFLVERQSGGSKNAWEPLRPPTGLDLWFCCSALDPSPPEPGAFYRVTAVSNDPPNYRSSPVVSNSIFISKIRTDPPVLNDLELITGASVMFPADQFGKPDLPGAKLVSLDSTVVTIGRPPGYLVAKKPGRTYIVAAGLAGNGAVRSWIWRVTVQPQPR